MKSLHSTAESGSPHGPARDKQHIFESIQDLIFEQLARIGKAVGNKQRLKLLELLAQTERSVEELAEESRLSIANVSQHLQVLRNVGLVEATKRGLYVYYRLSDSEVLGLLKAIRTLGEKRLGELGRILRTFLAELHEIQPLSAAELLDKLKRREVVVIDVRPLKEYLAGHIPGALSIPLDELETRVRELPERKEIVAYCRGPYCLLADRAIDILRKAGKQARRLAEGFPEWAAAKLPVEKTNSATPSGSSACQASKKVNTASNNRLNSRS